MADVICTIIAKNYISFARTLCQSFLEHHPDGRCYVLITDDYDGYLDPSSECFSLVGLQDLGISDVKRFSFRYNVIEFATACKPFFLQYVLDKDASDKVLYIDPDICVLNSLETLYDQLNQHDIIVTPHIEEDFPEDNCLPNDSVVMLHGIFNLGFIGVRRCLNTEKFLRWWQHKLLNKCLIDYKKGYFVDQKFMDLALGLFDNIGIIRNCGYNVSYWNLHSRRLWFDTTWKCNDGKLYFYHFSNFKPDKPEQISAHQGRFNFGDMPDLKRLYHEYASKVMDNGYLTTKKWPYTHNYFSNGKLINDVIRKVYRGSKDITKLADPFEIGNYGIKHRSLFEVLRTYKRCTKFILSKI